VRDKVARAYGIVFHRITYRYQNGQKQPELSLVLPKTKKNLCPFVPASNQLRAGRPYSCLIIVRKQKNESEGCFAFRRRALTRPGGDGKIALTL
jgi:hypothetical protein